MRLGVLVIMCLLVARPVHADDKADAVAAWEEAKRLVSEGNYAAACPLFEASFNLDRALGALLNLADCFEHIGKTASAWARYRESAEMARKAGDEKRERFATDRAAGLEPTLLRMVVRVGADAPPGLVVTRDGTDITALLGASTPVDPGEHVIEASAPGFVTVTGTVTASDRDPTMTYEVPALEEAPEADLLDERAPAVRLDTRARRTRRNVALGVAGGGVVLAGVGVFFGVRGFGQWDDSRAECPDNFCSPRGRELVDGARSSARVANVCVGLGAAALVTGAILWFTAPGSREVVVQPVAAPDGAGVTIGGSF